MADPQQSEAKPLPPTPAAPQVEEKIMEGKPVLKSNLDIVNDCDK